MAVRIPVEPFVPPAVPGVPQPSTTTTSGTGSSPGNPTAPTATSSAGPSVSIIDYYKTKGVGLLRPALTSHYVCRFQPPPGAESFLKQGESFFPGSDYSIRRNQELIELSCSEASLPGASLMTNEITDDHTGVTERPAYRRQYDDRIDFTFYVDRNYGIINFFERWISYCVGENNQSNLDDRNYFYRANFPDDYQTDALYITKFERDYSENALEYKFIRAYPLSINSMPVSYESSQLLKCTVSFSFVRYVRNKVKSERPQVVGSTQNSNGTWNVELLQNDSVRDIVVTNEEYQRLYAPRNL